MGENHGFPFAARRVSKIVFFNKPYGVLSQFTPQGRWRGLGEFIPVKGVYVAGRLDADSEGLLLLTDDGALVHRITDPRHRQATTYLVQIEGHADMQALESLRRGVLLKDGPTLPAQVRALDGEPGWLWPRDPPVRFRKTVPDAWIELTINEGRNRQVRRMTAAVGLPTLRLVRASIGDYALDDLQPGQWKAV